MKIRVTLKDPDTMHDAVVDAVAADSKTSISGVSEHERRSIAAERQSEIQSLISNRWMPYGEYLTVEFRYGGGNSDGAVRERASLMAHTARRETAETL